MFSICRKLDGLNFLVIYGLFFSVVAKNSSALGISSDPRLSVPEVGMSESCHSLVVVAEEDHQTSLESVDLKDEDSWVCNLQLELNFKGLHTQWHSLLDRFHIVFDRFC